MTHIIAVVNLKGGVGKTSLAVNLACQLHDEAPDAVLVDADEQASAAEWAGAGLLPIQVHRRPADEPATIREWVGWVRSLKARWVVIDPPPHAGLAAGAAMGLADIVIIPCGASGVDIRAIRRTLGLLREARERRTGGVPKAMLVPTKADGRTASGRDLAAALATLGEPVGPTIRNRIAVADASLAGVWIGTYQLYGDAHNDVIALARAVRAEVEGQGQGR